MHVGYGAQENVAMIENILHNINAKNIPIDIVLMNAAMDAFIEANEPHSAVRLFQYLSHECNMNGQPISKKIDEILTQSFNLDPHRISYFYQKENSISPNIKTFNILLKALRELGPLGYRTTLKIIDLSKDTEFEMDSISLNILVDICCTNGNTKLALKVLI